MKKMLVAPYAVLDPVYQSILPTLKNRCGTQFTIIVPSQKRKVIYEQYCDADDKVFTFSELLAFGKKFVDPTEAVKAASKIEKRYGIRVMRDVIQLDRGYANEIWGHLPYALQTRNKRVSHEHLLREVAEIFSAVEVLFEQHRFDACCVWPLDLISVALGYCATEKGIPVTRPHAAKYKGQLAWSHGMFGGHIGFIKRLQDETVHSAVQSVELEPPKLPVASFSNLSRAYSIKSKIKKMSLIIAKRVYKLARGKFRGLNKDWFLGLYKQLIFEIRSVVVFKFLEKNAVHELEEIISHRYFFYAISQEPEYSVQCRAKEFNDQAVIIRQMAQCLPSDVKLVVKEHAILGARRLGFYKSLQSFPNVILAHPKIQGLELSRYATGVATFGGTVALEALNFGKGVLLFSQHSEFRFCESVFEAGNLVNLPEKLALTIAVSESAASDQAKIEGQRLINVIAENSFDASETRFFNGKSPLLDPHATEKAVDLLIRTCEDMVETPTQS